jgi:hypothetical protein
MSDVKKVNDVKVKEQCHTGIPDRYAASKTYMIMQTLI